MNKIELEKLILQIIQRYESDNPDMYVENVLLTHNISPEKIETVSCYTGVLIQNDQNPI